MSSVQQIIEKVENMRIKRLFGVSLMVAFALVLSVGCSGGTEAQPTKVVPPKSEKAAAAQPTAQPKSEAPAQATAGTQQQSQSASKFPEKAVNLIVAYGPGGTDTTARLLAAQLEKELKQPVTVTNVTGGGGWNGWGQLAAAAPDGYTIGYINVPNMFAGYLDPKIKRPESLASFVPIMNHVTDYCIWAVKADSKFKSLKDLIDFAKANPNQVSIAAHGAGGDDDLAIRRISKLTGIQLKEVHNDGTATSITQLLGGHIDVVGANVSEVVTQHKNKELRVLGVMSDKPSEFLPDVPTFKDQGVNVVFSVSRGIAAPAKTPPEIVKILEDALTRAMQSPEHVQKAKELSLSLDIIKGDAYLKFLKEQEQSNKELMGW